MPTESSYHEKVSSVLDLSVVQENDQCHADVVAAESSIRWNACDCPEFASLKS